MFRFTNLIILRLTRDCNLNCKYCFMTNKHEFKGEILPIELFKKMVDELIKIRITHHETSSRLSLIFHGGEALMVGKDKFEEYCKYITDEFAKHNLHLNLGIQTNATLLDDEYAALLKKYDVHVGLSFDGIAGSNSERDIKEKVFEQKFDILENNDVDYGFIIVAGKHNADKLVESGAYLENLPRVTGYKINYAEDMINWDNEKSIELPGDVFFEKAFKPEIEKLIATGSIYESHTLNYLHRTLTSIFLQVERDETSGCGTLYCGSTTQMIGINPDGTSHYCDRYNKEYEETYVMNVLDYDFLGLHQIKRALDFNRIKHEVTHETGCDTCYARDMCEGGCMGFHRSKKGFNGIDKNIVCKLYKTFYNYVYDNLDRIIDAFIQHDLEFITRHKFIGFKKNNIKKLYDIGYGINVSRNDNNENHCKFMPKSKGENNK